VLGAQTSAYKFEVAVIKPSNPRSSDVWLIPEPHGGFRAQNVVVWQLIKHAYYVRDQQLTGGPPWIKTDRYDIVAKPEKIELEPLEPSTTSPTRFTSHMTRHRQRIQALLRDRFGLVLGTEMKAMPFYSLKVAKTGHKMEVAGDHDLNPIARGGSGRFEMTTDIKGITSMLTDVVGRPVVDETGLTEHHKVRLEWAPDSADPTDTRASIFTALNEQLGLRLESRKGPVPVFVIQKVERPTEN
jgi:uncharacterized protein (TIGR03435 family)